LRILVICSSAVLLATADQASAQTIESQTTEVRLSTGLDYTAGKYGMSDTTDILVGLTDISLQQGNFLLSASLPYLDIQGPATIVAGAGGVPVAKRKAGVSVPLQPVTRTGWGDPNFGLTYSLSPEDLDGYAVDLTGVTKIATANAAKGLSTGENDFGFSVDVSRQMGIWSPFVTFGYRVPGSSAAYSLNSAPSFSVGTSVQLDQKIVAIFSYDFDGTISDTLADSQQFFASASWIFSDRLTLTAYAEKGISGGAPGIGTGLMLGWKLT
jgi:hypothetical protein